MAKYCIIRIEHGRKIRSAFETEKSALEYHKKLQRMKIKHKFRKARGGFC